MAYATPEDVEAALGRSLGSQDVDFMLESATDQINGYLNTVEIDPIPGPVVRVCAEMVAAAINRPQTPAASQDPYNPGGFAYLTGPMSVGPWLTAAQRERLDNFRIPVFSVELTSETTGSDVWTNVMSSSDPYAGTDLTGSGTIADK